MNEYVPRSVVDRGVSVNEIQDMSVSFEGVPQRSSTRTVVGLTNKSENHSLSTRNKFASRSSSKKPSDYPSSDSDSTVDKRFHRNATHPSVNFNSSQPRYIVISVVLVSLPYAMWKIR